MPPPHLSFLEKLEQELQTSNGKTVEVWELRHKDDDVILSAWAKHFRQHYCKDSDIDRLRKGTNKTRKDFLNAVKFPDSKIKPGPSTRAGDFGEILVSDFLEFIENCEVLSKVTRYSNKINRNSSPQGCDVIGFRFEKEYGQNSLDELVVYEVKAKFTGTAEYAEDRLQEAIEDSGKDESRIGTSLNAMKQRFIENRMENEAEKVERFQNIKDNPYKMANGAVAFVCNNNYSNSIATNADTSKHPRKNNLRLIIIKGENMMTLVHELYRRAADEA